MAAEHIIRPFRLRDIYSVISLYLTLPEKDRRFFHPCAFRWWLVVPIVAILAIEPLVNKIIRTVFTRGAFFPLIATSTIPGRCAGVAYFQSRKKLHDGKYLATLGLVVSDEVKRKGVGSRLMKALIDDARKNKVRRIWLTVLADNEAAIRLYRKNGFLICNTHDKGDAWDGKSCKTYEMKLNINSH